MVRKFLLLLCIAFVVIGFAYPCVVLPVGTYTGQVSETETMSYKFSFGGTVDVTTKTKNEKDDKYDAVTVARFYKLKGDTILICDDEGFKEDVEKLQICSIYKISGMGENSSCTNIGSICLTAGVGFVALLLILSIPSKRRIVKEVEAKMDRKRK